MHKLLEEMRKKIQHSLDNWDVKGIIDSKQQIYVVSQDTKLLSKVFESVIYPIIHDFAEQNDLDVVPASSQIKYPDYSIRKKNTNDKWTALDIKSSYRIDQKNISGLTLGTFRGSLREPDTTRYSTFPYNDYESHYCLCVIYSRAEQVFENRSYTLTEIDTLPPTITDIEVYLQEKYKIASYTAGSGNTANIGSVTKIKELANGKGPFAEFGEEIFEEYWRNYLRKEDANKLGIKRPYKNLKTFLEWKDDLN